MVFTTQICSAQTFQKLTPARSVQLEPLYLEALLYKGFAFGLPSTCLLTAFRLIQYGLLTCIVQVYVFLLLVYRRV